MSRRLVLPIITLLVILNTLGLVAVLLHWPVTEKPVEFRMVRQWMYTHPRPQRYAKYQVNERIDYEIQNNSKWTIEVRMIRLRGRPKKPSPGLNVGKVVYAVDSSREHWFKMAPGETLRGWMIGHPTIERDNPDWKAYSLEFFTEWRYVNHFRDTFRETPDVYELLVPGVQIPPLSTAPEPAPQ